MGATTHHCMASAWVAADARMSAPRWNTSLESTRHGGTADAASSGRSDQGPEVGWSPDHDEALPRRQRPSSRPSPRLARLPRTRRMSGSEVRTRCAAGRQLRAHAGALMCARRTALGSEAPARDRAARRHGRTHKSGGALRWRVHRSAAGAACTSDGHRKPCEIAARGDGAQPRVQRRRHLCRRQNQALVNELPNLQHTAEGGGRRPAERVDANEGASEPRRRQAAHVLQHQWQHISELRRHGERRYEVKSAVPARLSSCGAAVSPPPAPAPRTWRPGGAAAPPHRALRPPKKQPQAGPPLSARLRRARLAFAARAAW